MTNVEKWVIVMVWILGHYGAQKFENLKISQICRLDFLEITCDDE